MARARKIRRIISLAMQVAMIYRWNMFLLGFANLVPLFVTIVIWQSIYAARGDAGAIGGFGPKAMTSYFIYVMVIQQIISSFAVDFDIAYQVRNGYMSKFLVKPIDFLWYRWVYHLGNRIFFSSAVMIPLFIGIVLFRRYIVLPNDWRDVALLVALLLPLAFINYLISFCIGMISFWMLEVSTLFWIFYTARFLLSGQMFPLTILPPPFDDLVRLLPFTLVAYFPAALLLGKLTAAEIVANLALIAFWTAVLTHLARSLWRRGLYVYDAAGI
jgi:ABC-2 type transport system permease protein